MSTSNRKRLFPSYTLEELKSWTGLDESTAAKVAEEIAARENGATHATTPQVEWDSVPMVNVGRL